MQQKQALGISGLVMALVFLISQFDLPQTHQHQGDKVKVVEVIDGDTVKIHDEDGLDTVRLVGIDAPETFEENDPEEFGLPHSDSVKDCMDEHGEKATRKAKEFSLNREANLLDDSLNPDRGPYDRKLAYIEINGTTLGEHLMEKGLGTVYPTAFEKRNEYEQLEEIAKNKEKGVWSCG